MATSTTIAEPNRTETHGRSSVVSYLRLEGLAAAAASAVLYAHTRASWGLFFGLWLVPDLSMLGYLGGACRGARIYNGFHSYVAPVLLAVLALLLPAPAVLPLSLIWINHIGVDRMFGYGLKYGDGFASTHLGRPGRARRGLAPAKGWGIGVKE